MLRFPCPAPGVVFLTVGVTVATGTGLIGVAGASCGGPGSGWVGVGATEVLLPMLTMAGSTNG